MFPTANVSDAAELRVFAGLQPLRTIRFPFAKADDSSYPARPKSGRGWPGLIKAGCCSAANFSMNINVEHQPNCRAVAHIRVPGEEVKKSREDIVGYYAKQVRLPGYRPGKTPKPVVAKRFQSEIGQELEKQLINDGLRQAIKNEGLDVMNILAVKDKLHHDADSSFSFTVEMMLSPKFELPEYKGIPVKLPRIEVTDADVDHDLLHLREHSPTFEDVERAAANDDAVNASYSVSLDALEYDWTRLTPT